ncbi:hypothetical protein PL71_14045 [Pseudoalteromonas distincta]|uniref:Uncharacterized protein n=1 Tax=Pseudoalteromonas distincta TaxID=77608 RepID=A0A4P9J6P0_9GAMM|nr:MULTISPECIES: hypothetical protein [Pseudoalteromonas]KAA1153130.1 hypothetical protein EU511_18845 [Pseudoalteromonas distincta]KHM46648.1 hypothetical protein PL71_14045 [Pseudoalteromonas elyakovii]KID39309.1 hypothetical protein QT16_07150 [Pseudoalteromonas distincta]MDN3474319.1 hypothetical protein [Pseudoalteromonas sp. APC 3355]MDP4485192.1 hypothetical protein [Pseudoalteromonas elyakovii]
MEINKSNQSILIFVIPLLTAYFGSKVIFHLFSFEYLVFTDTFDILKLLIDISVFGVLFYISSLGVGYVIRAKT